MRSEHGETSWRRYYPPSGVEGESTSIREVGKDVSEKVTFDLTAGRALASVTSPFHGPTLILFPTFPVSSQFV